MPGLDGTGPMGLGPMTGRGLGWCRYGYAGYGPYTAVPWYRRLFGFWPRWGWGRGYGWGLGLGWGFRRGWGWRGGPWTGYWW